MIPEDFVDYISKMIMQNYSTVDNYLYIIIISRGINDAIIAMN